MSGIQCPVMLTVGEYDARSPAEMLYQFYDKIRAPKELWVYDDAAVSAAPGRDGMASSGS